MLQLEKRPLVADEDERRAALRRARLLDTAPERAFDDFARIAAMLAGAPIARVNLVDEQRVWSKASFGPSLQPMTREGSFCSVAIASTDVLVVTDAKNDARFRDLPSVAGPDHVRFYAGAPILDEGGHALGTLCLFDRAPRELAADVREALARLASLVASHIEMRRRELEAHELRAVAASNADRLRMMTDLLDLAQDMIFVTDPVRRILFWNRGAEQCYGFTREEAEGALAHELLQTEFPQPRQEILDQLLHDGRWEGEVVHTTKNGRRVAVDSRWVLNVDERKRPVAILCVNRDVTARREVTRMKDEFVSVVSHELRTPLTSIRGALGLIEGGVVGEVPKEILDMVSIARANADRLIRLINDILDLEKMEAGKIELRPSELVLSDIVRKVFAELQAIADRSEVTLVAEVTRDLVLVADEDRVMQLLTNLVSNAVKFSPKGGHVTVRAFRRGPRSVRLSVADQGPGIPSDQVGRLFAKFQQLDAADDRKRGGTGLGLAISKAIAEQHGGSIQVQSVVGEGSTFVVDMPSTLASARTAAIVARRLALLIDPRGVLSERLARLLTEEGCLFARTKSLEEAEGWLEGSQPSFIILDVDLEGDPDGQTTGEILDRLALRYSKGDAPTILLTGHGAGEGLALPLPVQWLADPNDDSTLRQVLRFGSRAPGPARVLLVEDDPEFRTIMAARLRALGVTVREAGTGREAVDLVRSEKPDLLVLDVGLPGLDGFDVVDMLRNDKGGLVPLLVYTARDLASDDRRALTLGVTRWLTKARTSEADFVHAVRDMLGSLIKQRPA